MARRKVDKSKNNNPDNVNEDNFETAVDETIDENESETTELSELEELKNRRNELKLQIEDLDDQFAKANAHRSKLVSEMDNCINRIESLEYGSPVNREQRHVMGVLNAIAKQREQSQTTRSPLDVALGNRPRPNFFQTVKA